MKTFLLILVAFTMFVFAPACFNTTPVEPDEMTEAQYFASVDTFVKAFVEKIGPMESRSGQALEDYTDMTCEIPGGYAGALPAYWSMYTNEAMNGEDWTEWTHPIYPWISAQYMYIYIMDLYHQRIGCETMTRMVEFYEEVAKIDIPNTDEVEWPVF